MVVLGMPEQQAGVKLDASMSLQSLLDLSLAKTRTATDVD